MAIHSSSLLGKEDGEGEGEGKAKIVRNHKKLTTPSSNVKTAGRNMISGGKWYASALWREKP